MAMNSMIRLTIPDEDTCWQAVQERDARYSDRFVFGVRSTGIFCRPGCAARRPRRDQVVFFQDGGAARAAGFRPCRRCRPEEAAGSSTGLAERARRLMDESEEPLALAELAGQLGVSPYHLQRTFKAAFGVTPRQYSAARKLERFKTGVQQGQDVTSALYSAGFGSSSRLYEQAGQNLGMTPGAYRRGGKGMQIDYSIFETALGWMLLAATPRGICKLAFGESEQELETLLAGEFPRAIRNREDARLANWAGALQAYLAGSQAAVDLPLDVQGTLFQQQVWQALRQIPAGQTRTYTQLANQIGRPGAVRAAASACGANPVAVVIPCHRIVRSDGGLGGYHWGLERKKKLLEREQHVNK